MCNFIRLLYDCGHRPPQFNTICWIIWEQLDDTNRRQDGDYIFSDCKMDRITEEVRMAGICNECMPATSQLVDQSRKRSHDA